MNNKRSLIVSVVISLALVVAIICLIISYSSGEKKIHLIQSPFMQETGEKLFDADKSGANEEITVSTEIITDGLQNIGKLVTQEYFFTQVESYEKQVQAGPLSSKANIVYSYDGVVTAGVECDEIQVEKDEKNKIITITIPKSDIQDVNIDLDSFKIYEEKQGLWSKIKLADVNKSLIEFNKAAKEKAIDKGVLESADKNAEQVIDRFVKSLIDLGDYTIYYRHK